MDWISLAMETSIQLLKFLNIKESRKYQEKIIKLRKDIYEEERKERPNHTYITNLEHELFLISENIVAHAEGQKASN